MRRSGRLVATVLFFSVLFLSILPSHTIAQKYVEDFTTKQYCDTLNTTAWWETVAGELKLFPFEISLFGSYDTPGSAWDVAVSGDYAFVGDGGSGLQVIDISDPTNPTLLGNYDTPGSAVGVAVSGDYAFVADGYSGLQVIDISDPTNPTLLGNYDTPGDTRGVAVSGDYAFVADFGSGLQVIDISDPTNPTLLGNYNTPGITLGVAVSGDHAFVADFGSGLQVIDISDPTNPTLSGNYDTPGSAWGVAVSGDYAFVGDGGSGLQVIDISDPTNPTLLGNYDTPGIAHGVVVSGDYAFVTDEVSGLQVIDISDPTDPTLLGNYDTPGDARGIVVSGEYAFVGDNYPGLQVIDISDPTIPTLLGDCDALDYAQSIAVSGDYAFVADDTQGLQVIDITDITAPTLVGSHDTPGVARDVAVSGDYAFVADHGSGLQVIDITDPTAPTLLGDYDTPGAAWGVAVSGDYAFVADHGSGLQVIDITDPTAPTLLGNYDTPGLAYGVAVSGDYAFVADYGSGLQVIDISDPTAPTLLGSYVTPAIALRVAVSGDYSFVADGSGLQVIDISDPTTPTLLGSYDTPGLARGVAVSGDYAFVADQGSGLQVIDITDPTAPTLLGGYDTPGLAYGVAVSGDHAFVADYYSGLQVIQVYQSEVDSHNNIGQSTIVNALPDTIHGARLTTAQRDAVTWELSANGGANWQEIVSDGSWSHITVPGVDLLWRSTHTWASPGVNPSVIQLEVECLGAEPVIDLLVDVPDDQGRSLYINFTRSGHDFLEETEFPVVGYAVYRRLDDPLFIQQVNDQPAGLPEKKLLDHPQLASFDPSMVRTIADRTFIVGSAESAAGTLPPGVWEGVGWILPVQADDYWLRVNTLVDSTTSGPGWTVFVTVVHTSTPDVWYVSESDSGYSLDNIAPEVPLGLAVAYNTGSGNHLTWDPAPEPDFQYYRIYRGDSETFMPDPGNLVHETVTEDWNDPEYDGWDVHYKVTVLDYAGNESPATSPGSITGDNTPDIPKRFALHQNVPNPFNPSTIIRFDLPQAAHTKLSVYDVKGGLIATLVDRHMTEGCKEVAWYAKDARGREVSSGIYFYRLVVGDFVQAYKMVLLR